MSRTAVTFLATSISHHFGDIQSMGNFPNGLKAAMQAKDIGPTELARLSGTSKQNIDRWAAGKYQLRRHHAEMLAPHLDVDPKSLIFHDTSRRTTPVPVIGYVAAGDRLTPTGAELGFVEPPSWATGKTVAVEIRGDSLGPFLDGWLAFYDEVRRPLTDDLAGQLCVIGLADDRVVIKRPKRTRKAWLLLSQNGDPITDRRRWWADA